MPRKQRTLGTISQWRQWAKDTLRWAWFTEAHKPYRPTQHPDLKAMADALDILSELRGTSLGKRLGSEWIDAQVRILEDVTDRKDTGWYSPRFKAAALLAHAIVNMADNAETTVAREKYEAEQEGTVGA